MPSLIRVTFVEPSLAGYRVPFFRALARDPGLRVRLNYAESGRPNALADGFEAIFSPRRSYRLFGHPVYWQQAQIDAADDDDADVVSFDWDVHYASLIPALLKAKRRGVATILWGHGTSKNDGTWRARPRELLARLADVIVTYAEPARASLIAKGWPEARVFCSPNAIDQAPVQAAFKAVRAGLPNEMSARLAARRALGLPLEGPLLLFVSRLDRTRRVDVLVDAIARLTATFPGLMLAIVGDGAAEQVRLEAQASEAGVRNRIRFAGAEYDEQRLARWYAACDLVVHPAWLGLSVYHAMGHARPVVSGDDPRFHPPEAASIEHEVTGLRFTHGDAMACASAIERLLKDDSLRDRLGETAQRRAIESHSIETMTREFAHAIRAAASLNENRR